MGTKNIKNFTIAELKREMGKMSMPSYRAEQVFFWVYKRGACSFSSMANIPKDLKDSLSQNYHISSVSLREHLKSVDGSEKFLFELSDKNLIESVLIYSGNRKTLCLSTQVGCKYGCAFCASGTRGFVRNLAVSEILDQILYLQHTLGRRITNFVFMGMGEPLDNYDNVSKAIMIMNCREALGIGARRVTVSTCGIVPGIDKLKNMRIQINLSLSLHATNNRLRSELVPVNRRYSLEAIIAACQDFEKKMGTKVTLEYVLIRGKNDLLEDALALSHIAKKLKAKVNLIPCSPVGNKGFEPPLEKDIDVFRAILIKNRVNAIVRESKGKDIHAACGQLAIRFL